jgi:hypothetical protein
MTALGYFHIKAVITATSGAKTREPVIGSRPARTRWRFCAVMTALMRTQRVGWVEHFAKPINRKRELMGIASLHPSYGSLPIENGGLSPAVVF